MAIVATFKSDFSDFTRGVQEAEVSLKTFESGASSVEKTLTRMSDSFSGVKVVQSATLMAEAVERVGGVSKLTADELEKVSAKAQEAADKLTAMGVAVPPKIQALADATKETKVNFEGLAHSVESFDLDAAMSRPLGTAKDAAVGLASSFGLIGPTGLAAVGAVVGLATALAAAAAAAFEVADRTGKVGAAIQDTSEKTGIAVPALSVWRGALEIAGSSLDQFGSAVFMMQRRMVEGGAQFEAGLHRINVSMSELQSLTPDQQFLALAEGIRALEDPAQRSAAAMELFGRPGRELLPLIMKNLRGLNDESAALASTWTEQDAKAAEEFEMASRALHLQLQNIVDTIGKDLVPLFATAINFAKGSIGWFLTEGAGVAGQLADELDRLAHLAALAPGILGVVGATGGGGLGGLFLKPQEGLGTPKAPAAPTDPTAASDKMILSFTQQAAAVAVLQDHIDKLRESTIALTPVQQQQAAAMLAGGDSAKEVAAELTNVSRAFGGAAVSAKAVEDFKKQIDDSKKATEEWNAAFTTLQPLLSSSAWDGSIDGLLRLGGSVKDVAVYFGTSEGVVRSHAEAMKVWSRIVGIEAPKSAQDLSSELHKLGEAIPQKFFDDAAKASGELQKIEAGARLTGHELAGMGTAAKPAMDDLNATFGTVGLNFTELEKVSVSGLQHTAKVAEDTYQFMATHAGMFSKETIEHFKELATAADAAAGDMKAQFTVVFTDLSKDLPNIIIRGLQGGTGAMESAMESLGISLATKLGKVLSANLAAFAQPTSAAGKAAFDAAQIGAGVLAAETDNPETKAGQVGNLAAKGAGYGAVAGPLGMAVGAGVGALIGALKVSPEELAARSTFADFQKQFGSLEQTINAVGAAYLAAGKTGVEAQEAMKKALDATHVSAQAEKEALDEINGVMDQQKQDQADLTAAVQKYGFTIAELGPTMQKQQLDEQAKALMNDWQLLIGSGIQMTVVNEHMASSMNDYLKIAKQTGQEVPKAMEPIIQKMIDQGLLTDENGNKITDMKDLGITFSDTMTQGFDRVVKKLQEMIDKISGVSKGLKDIPAETTVTVNVHRKYSDDSDIQRGAEAASGGGLVTEGGIQLFAGGGVVLPFRPRGSDTVPAMLTPGEMVLTAAQQRSLLQGGTNNVVQISTAFERTLDARFRRLEEALTSESRRAPERLAAAVAGALARQGTKR